MEDMLRNKTTTRVTMIDHFKKILIQYIKIILYSSILNENRLPNFDLEDVALLESKSTPMNFAIWSRFIQAALGIVTEVYTPVIILIPNARFGAAYFASYDKQIEIYMAPTSAISLAETIRAQIIAKYHTDLNSLLISQTKVFKQVIDTNLQLSKPLTDTPSGQIQEGQVTKKDSEVQGMDLI